MTVVGRVVTAGIVAVGSIVLGGSAQAVAVTQAGSFAQAAAGTRGDSSGQITSPSDGQVVSSSSVTVSARTGLMQLRMGLYVDGPSTPTQKVAGGGANQTISGTFDAGNAPNGTFNVTLKGEITGTRYASSTFKLRRPAETPGNVSASLQDTTKVLVTWAKGSEPDLQSFEVSNTQSGVVGRLPVDSACDGGSCKATLTVPAKAAGQKVGFTVKAFRGDGDGGSIGSDESGAAYVTVPAPPTAKPKESAKPRETPKQTKKVDPLPTLPAKKQTQPTSKPTTRKPTTSKVPAIPDTDSDGNLPIPTADDRGETGGLTPEGTKTGTDTAPVEVGRVKAQSDESPIGNIGQYGLYIAGGLLLLLLGAHAGAWARRRALATEGGSAPQPPTTRGAGTTAASVAVAGPDGAVPAAGVVRDDDEDFPPVTAAPLRRRPAVILAVAKTRIPDQSSHTPKSALPDRPHGSNDRLHSSNDRPHSSDDRPYGSNDRSHGTNDRLQDMHDRLHGQADHPHGQADHPEGQSGLPYGHADRLYGQADRLRGQDGLSGDLSGGQNGSSASRSRVQEGPSALARPGVEEWRPAEGAGVRESPSVDHSGGRGLSPVDRPGAQGASPADRRRAQGVSAAGRSGVDEPSRPPVLDQARKEMPPTVPPLGGGEGRRVEGNVGELGGVKEAHVVRQEPVRIALPSSAVTDVPEASVSVSPPAVRIEDRWDDYLPPSPRSMEDSGFWERPQPGAADFWAADDDEADGHEDDDEKRAYAGRRKQGGHG